MQKDIAVVAAAPIRHVARFFHPLHVGLLTSSVPLYLGGLLADIAYARTYQIQWTNFAAWLIAGAMVFTGLAFVWSLFDISRSSFRVRPALMVFLLLAAMFILGLLNSFIHARDAYGSMPSGLVLSIIVTVLGFGALWISMRAPRSEVVP